MHISHEHNQRTWITESLNISLSWLRAIPQQCSGSFPSWCGGVFLSSRLQGRWGGPADGETLPAVWLWQLHPEILWAESPRHLAQTVYCWHKNTTRHQKGQIHSLDWDNLIWKLNEILYANGMSFQVIYPALSTNRVHSSCSMFTPQSSWTILTSSGVNEASRKRFQLAMPLQKYTIQSQQLWLMHYATHLFNEWSEWFISKSVFFKKKRKKTKHIINKIKLII